MRTRLVPARLTHVGPLASNLRDIDRRECEAFGRSAKDALRLSLRTSLHALTAIDPEDRPLCMFGVCPLDLMAGRGLPWLLASDAMLDHATDLMRLGPKVIRWWQETFTTMENLVSVENVKAIALLRYWGAQIGEDVKEYGGIAFVRFAFVAIQGEHGSA